MKCGLFLVMQSQDKIEAIESKLPGAKKKQLKTLSRTRWVEQHNVLEKFIDLYSAIIEALCDIVAYRQDTW